MNWTAEIQFNTIYVLTVKRGISLTCNLFCFRKNVGVFVLICLLRYSPFDALQLISYTDEYFHCENCNGELLAESDKLSSEEMGDGDDNARKRRREKLNDMQQRIDVSTNFL